MNNNLNSLPVSSLYSYQIGKTPLLSIAELTSFFPEKNFIDITGDHIIINDPAKNSDQQDFLNRLGGTVKIEKIFSVLPSSIALSNLSHLFAETIINIYHDKKISFAINVYPAFQPLINAKNILPKVKKELKENNIKCRFVNNNYQNISSAASIKEKLLSPENLEINIICTRDKIYLSKTVAIQDIDSYGKRDYEIKLRDPHSGMLPPKLAQIMINLATAQLPSNNNLFIRRSSKSEDGQPIIYDPFCGCGTILMEALLQGKNVIGSDLSEKAVYKTQKNLEILRQEFHIDPKLKSYVFQADATKIQKIPLLSDPDNLSCVIVTEPYLGEPANQNPTLTRINETQISLKSLYLAFFQNLKKLDVSIETIIMIFPYFRLNGKRLFLQMISEIEKTGYKPESMISENFQKKFKLGLNKFPSILYERKDQIIGREIWKFVKK